MTTLFDDFRYGLRMVRKYPSTGRVAVSALALGIVANTSIFSVAGIFLFKPVAIPQLSDVVAVVESRPPDWTSWRAVAPANFADRRSQDVSFETMAAY